MFTPNLKGILRRKIGRDVHGSHLLGPSIPCPFGPVSMLVGANKTSVRADSSASRGSADEISVSRGKILTPSFVSISVSDIFIHNDDKYEIVAIHPRYSIAGTLDHNECDLEAWLE